MSDAEKIRTQCPNCGQRMRLKAKFLGRTIKCPTCESPFTVEEDALSAEDTGAGIPEPPPPPAPASSGGDFAGEAFVDAPPTPPAVEDDDLSATVPQTLEDDSMGAYSASSPAGEGDAMTYAQDQFASDPPPAPGVEVVSPYGPGTEMPPAVEASKHFKNFLAPEQEVEQEFDLGGSGFIFRNHSRVAVTRDTVLVLRRKWWIWGIFPGSDVWFTEYPIFSRDLRRVRSFVPSAGRLALVFLIGLILSFAAWWGVTQSDVLTKSVLLRGIHNSLTFNELAEFNYRLIAQDDDLDATESTDATDMDEQGDVDPVEETGEGQPETMPNETEPADTAPEATGDDPGTPPPPPTLTQNPKHTEVADRLKPYDFYAWWWVLLPLLLPVLYYIFQRPAQLQTDAFKVPTGRDGKSQKTVRACAKYIVERRRGTTHVAY